MSRLWVLLSSAVIVLTFHSASADLGPQANGLPGGLIIRRQTADFDAMVRQTQPDFVWNGTDMLWITKDASGKITFSMDHAYTVQLTGQRDKICCLFKNDGYALGNEGCDGPAYPFTLGFDAQPAKIAHDPKWGDIYQARWLSAEGLGSGDGPSTRNIFLLCDGQHGWHLIGDGPDAECGQDGANDATEETVTADVRWTGNAAHPAELSFTLLSTHEWDLDPNRSFSMTVRCKMVPANVPSHLDSPWLGFQREGPYYVIASQSESLASFAAKVAHCWGLDLGVWGLSYGDRKLTAGTNLIYQDLRDRCCRRTPRWVPG